MNRRQFCGFLGSAPLWGQQPSQTERPITLEVNRVNMLFTVSDKKGRFVNNLTKDDFDVIEGKRKQTILEFSAESDLPLRIALLVDTSNSIRDRFRFELETAGHFLQSVIRKNQDAAAIYSYDTQPELVQGLTDNTEILNKKLKQLRPGGGTAMYDAVYTACRDTLMIDQPRFKFRHALLLLGDGDDNASKHTRDQALEMVIKSDAVMHTISTNYTKSETEGDRILKYFAGETGGLAFFPFKAEDLAQDFENIANELRSQYSILYRPDPLKTDGLFHDVDVKLKNPSLKGLVIRSRKGYYAPKG